MKGQKHLDLLQLLPWPRGAQGGHVKKSEPSVWYSEDRKPLPKKQNKNKINLDGQVGKWKRRGDRLKKKKRNRWQIVRLGVEKILMWCSSMSNMYCLCVSVDSASAPVASGSEASSSSAPESSTLIWGTKTQTNSLVWSDISFLFPFFSVDNTENFRWRLYPKLPKSPTRILILNTFLTAVPCGLVCRLRGGQVTT